jgi:hypothetical protein
MQRKNLESDVDATAAFDGPTGGMHAKFHPGTGLPITDDDLPQKSYAITVESGDVILPCGEHPIEADPGALVQLCEMTDKMKKFARGGDSTGPGGEAGFYGPHPTPDSTGTYPTNPDGFYGPEGRVTRETLPKTSLPVWPKKLLGDVNVRPDWEAKKTQLAELKRLDADYFQGTDNGGRSDTGDPGYPQPTQGFSLQTATAAAANAEKIIDLQKELWTEVTAAESLTEALKTLGCHFMASQVHRCVGTPWTSDNFDCASVSSDPPGAPQRGPYGRREKQPWPKSPDTGKLPNTGRVLPAKIAQWEYSTRLADECMKKFNKWEVGCDLHGLGCELHTICGLNALLDVLCHRADLLLTIPPLVKIRDDLGCQISMVDHQVRKRGC